MHIHNVIKIHPFVLKILRKKHILHHKRIYPICNPKPLLPDINVHAKFEENQVRVRKRSADGRTDGRTLKRFGGYNIIPRHFFCGGV